MVNMPGDPTEVWISPEPPVSEVFRGTPASLAPGGLQGLDGTMYIPLDRDSPLPLSYRQLVNVTVRMYMVLLLLAAALVETAIPPLGQLDKGSFWIILVYAFEYFLFVGWVTVADAVHNPYRDWPGAYRWDEFVKAASINCVAVSCSG